MEEKKFQPYVPADKVVPEFTVFSVVLGALLAIVFGGANAYLGLRVGMTVSASIPAAVLSMGAIRFILKRDSILENNMVQTIGSAGESVAAGAIFTMPALFMWAAEGLCDMPSVVEIGGHVAKSLRRPHKQGRHRENRARGHGLTGRADGLDHVVLQNGVPLEDEADGAHREHRRRDGGGDRHADAQTEVGVGAAEHDGQQRAEYHGEHGEFRHNLVRRDIGLEFLLFHVLLLFLLYYRALRIRTDTFHFTKNITESQVKLHFSPYNLFLILLIFNRAIY